MFNRSLTNVILRVIEGKGKGSARKGVGNFKERVGYMNERKGKGRAGEYVLKVVIKVLLHSFHVS